MNGNETPLIGNSVNGMCEVQVLSRAPLLQGDYGSNGAAGKITDDIEISTSLMAALRVL
jgi:hypothetical protein